MTLLQQTNEVATLGASISTSNPSGGDKWNQVNIAGSAATIDSTHAAGGGTASIKYVPASGSTCSNRWNGFSSTAFAASGYYWIDTMPGAETWFVDITAGGARVIILEITSTGHFRVLDSRGTGTPVYNSALTYPTGQWVRWEVYATVAASGATIKAALYLGDSTTPTDSIGVTTPYTSGQTGTVPADTIIWGKGDSGTYASTFWGDAFQFNTAATDFIGPMTTPLATPVVTAGTTTAPTTIGGTNGSQVVTWPAVTNANSYNAYIANKASPLQSDFTLVATSVTSPYTFTGLSAGTYSYGIQAMP
jgi:hypothetical protein